MRLDSFTKISIRIIAMFVVMFVSSFAVETDLAIEFFGDTVYENGKVGYGYRHILYNILGIILIFVNIVRIAYKAEEDSKRIKPKRYE